MSEKNNEGYTRTCIICGRSGSAWGMWCDPNNNRRTVCFECDCSNEVKARGINLKNWTYAGTAIDIDYRIKELKEIEVIFSDGLALLQFGKNDEANEIFDRILTVKPKHRDANFFKGLSLLLLGKNNEALEMFDKILEKELNDQRAVLYRGYALHNLGKDAEAVEMFDKLLNIESKNLEFLNMRGISLGKLGRYQEAIKMFDSILSISPNEPIALKNKRIAQESLNKTI